MFDHISIGVRDVARAGRFYDMALAPLGMARKYDSETSLGYGRDAIGLWIGPGTVAHFANLKVSR